MPFFNLNTANPFRRISLRPRTFNSLILAFFPLAIGAIIGPTIIVAGGLDYGWQTFLAFSAEVDRMVNDPSPLDRASSDQAFGLAQASLHPYVGVWMLMRLGLLVCILPLVIHLTAMSWAAFALFGALGRQSAALRRVAVRIAESDRPAGAAGGARETFDRRLAEQHLTVVAGGDGVPESVDVHCQWTSASKGWTELESMSDEARSEDAEEGIGRNTTVRRMEDRACIQAWVQFSYLARYTVSSASPLNGRC